MWVVSELKLGLSFVAALGPVYRDTHTGRSSSRVQVKGSARIKVKT